MSTLYVDTINEKTAGNGVQIPGHVVQVVKSGSFTDTIVTTSNTWTDTDLFVDITPSSTSNKILIIGSPVILLQGTGSIMRGSTRVMRTIGGGSATNVFNTDDFIEQYQVRAAANEHNTVGSITILDSPNTTSAVRYRVQIYYYPDANTTQIRLWGSGRGSTLIAQEIAQ